MNILMITSVYALSEEDRNGAFLVECNRYLRERGHRITVLAPSYRARPCHRVGGIEVRRFRYFLKPWETLTHFEGAPNKIRNPAYLAVAFFYILAGLVAAVRLARRERFDIIHVHWPFPHGIWGYAASRLSGAPMVLTFHGAELLLARKFRFVDAFLRHALSHSSAIISNSSFTAGQIKRLTDKEVTVIPFGTTVQSRVERKDRGKATKDILFVGRLIERKGVRYLLEAMPLILRALPCHLHIVSDGDRAQELRAQASSLGLDHATTFHGVVANEELERLYALADVFVLPAIIDDRGDTEGLGVVVVEALSFATPVVATAVGGLVDVVIDGQTGLAVPERSPAAIADAVVRVLTDQQLADRLAAQGLEHARGYFSWHRIVGELERLYREAGSGRGR